MGEKHLILGDLGSIVFKQLNNIVVVNLKADFPTPSAGVITLAANTVYLLGSNIDLTGDKITFSDGSRITCHGAATNQISSTGITSGEYIFTGVDVDCSIASIAIDCSGAKFINYSDSGSTKRFGLERTFVTNSTDVGIIDGGAAVRWFGNLFTNCSGGLTVQGATNEFDLLNNNTLAWTGTPTFLTIPSGAEFHSINIGYNSLHVEVGHFGFNISPDITFSAGGLMSNNFFQNGGTYLVGIDASHPDWRIAVDLNVGITGLLRLDPFQLIDTTYSTTTDLLGLTTDPYLLSVPNNYQELSTTFESGPLDCWVNHDQNGQDIVVCLADNNAGTGDAILGFGFTGKFTITDITYQGGGVTRYEFDGMNNPTATDPFDLTRIHVGETATFENCTNASNDGTFIITAVNDAGTKYLDVLNTNRTDGTDDETGSPGESWGGSVCWETITTGGTYQEATIPSVELPSNSDIRAGLRRGSTSGGNPTINIADESDVGGENNGWMTPINY